MLTFVIITLIKGIAHTLLLLLLPLKLLDFVFPSFVIAPVASAIGKATTLFVWLFGYNAYSFFVLTVIVTIFAIPTFKLSIFIVHFMHKIKTFFR